MESSQFDIKSLLHNYKDYWGPERDHVFDNFRNLPFTPFNRLEKIGKCCDFSVNFQKSAVYGGVSTVSKATGGDYEDEFTLVEGKANPKTKFNTQRKVNPNYGKKRVAPGTNQIAGAPRPNPKQAPKKGPGNYIRVVRTRFKDNMQVKADWQFKTDIYKTDVEKVTLSSNPVEEVLYRTGSIRRYDSAYDNITVKMEKQLVSRENPNTFPSTSEDSKMLEIIQNISENENHIPTLFSTDSLLSALMCLKHSNFPWDIIVRKLGNQIILDKAERGVTYLDLQTVNENISTDLPDDEKDMQKLCFEATNINRNFIQQVAGKDPVVLGGQEDGSSANQPGYIYKKYTLEKKFNVVVRSEVEGYQGDPESESYLLLKTFNEYDLNNGWRKAVENNKGALTGVQWKNNICKVNKWLCQAHFVDAEEVKVGFVTRLSQKDDKRHVLLAVDSYPVKNLMSTINFKMRDCWGVVKYIMDFIMKQEDGTYCFNKSSYKSMIRVYRVPEEKDEEENL